MTKDVDYEYIIEYVAHKKYHDFNDSDCFRTIKTLMFYAGKMAIHYYLFRTSNRKALSMLSEWYDTVHECCMKLDEIAFTISNPENPKIYYDKVNAYWSDESDSQFLIDDNPDCDDLPLEFDSREDFFAWFKSVRPNHNVFNEITDR